MAVVSTSSRVFICLCIGASFALARAANAQEETAKFDTRGGTVEIVERNDETNQGPRVLLNGTPVFEGGGISLGVEAQFSLRLTSDTRADALLLFDNSGGTACPGMFRILSVSDAETFSVSQEFGTCSDIVRVSISEDLTTARISVSPFSDAAGADYVYDGLNVIEIASRPTPPTASSEQSSSSEFSCSNPQVRETLVASWVRDFASNPQIMLSFVGIVSGESLKKPVVDSIRTMSAETTVLQCKAFLKLKISPGAPKLAKEVDGWLPLPVKYRVEVTDDNSSFVLYLELE